MNNYESFLTKYSLNLKKVIEHKKSKLFEFVFETKNFKDPKILEIELSKVFPFLDDIKITLLETGVELNEKEISPIWRDKIPKEDPKDSLAQEKKLSDERKETFSIKEWQKKVFSQKEKEIQAEKKVTEPKKKSNVLKPGEVIFGKVFDKEAQPISDIDFSNTIHEKNVCIKGKVFDIDSSDINSKSQLYTIAITDYTGSIYLKKFIDKSKKDLIEKIDQNIKPGVRIKVYGDLEYDDFSKDKVLKPKSALLLENKKREDKAEKKRIELHLHSQYSSMDGISKIDQIIQRAKDFGHKAVGITDHGVLQAFPDLQNASKNEDLKILYGLEGYLVDTGKRIVEGDQKASFDEEYVFFDLETTGISIYHDKIIEIAAVIVKDGEIISKFDTFVNPHEKLSQTIVDLTGITDKDLTNAIDEDTAIKEFLDFIGDRIIVAHNATFDMGFINKWALKNNKKLNLTVVDSLPLARLLVPEVSRYNMARLCSFFKIKNERAHRAIDDSIASAKVMDKLLKRAKEKGIEKFEDLNNLMDVQTTAKKNTHTNHIIIYPKNQQGLFDLYKLVSDSHLKYFNKRPRIPKEVLAQNRKNLIIGSACSSGELYEKIIENAPEDVLIETASFYDYLEVQPIDNNRYLMRKNPKITEETLKENNKKIIKIGEILNKPVVATGDVHFIDPEDSIYREVIQSSKKRMGIHIPLYFRTTEEMLQEFNYLSKDKANEIVIENPNKIVDMIDDLKPVPDGTFPPKIEGAEEDIRKMCMDKAYEVYGEELPEIVNDRITRELDSIINNGYAVLYLIAQKLVENSQKDGYLVGSRGSVGSSLVAWLCGITEVNSLPAHYLCPDCHYSEFPKVNGIVGLDLEEKNCPNCHIPMKKDGFDIPFETFLGFEGDKEPDIDLNFSGENQSRAHQFTEELFGKGKTFRAGTISTLAEKTAFGYAKNYFEESGHSVSKAEIERIKKGITGIKRTTGQHPGGIMVVPKDHEIYEFTPVQHPADDPLTSTVTTHFDYHSISGRLLKLDILGHDDPTMLKKLKDLTGVDPVTIPLDDPEVLSLFTSSKALNFKRDHKQDLGILGVPEFGTKFVQQIVKETKPKRLTDLIKISGLSHGTEVWSGNAQKYINNGTATIKDVICTRDDIMINLINYGLEPKDSFFIMEKVRKGKGLTKEEEKKMRDHNVPDWYIESCKKIQYMFPKAHAAAYVIMAFRIAWYKIHYPLAYYSCYFGIRAKEFDLKTIIGGYDSIKQEIERLKTLNSTGDISNKEQQSLTSLELALEMYARGFSCQGINLYKSASQDFLIDGDSLIPPFITVSGLGENAAQSLYDVLRNKTILSREDLLNQSKITKTNLNSLEELGCLEGLPKSNQVSFF